MENSSLAVTTEKVAAGIESDVKEFGNRAADYLNRIAAGVQEAERKIGEGVHTLLAGGTPEGDVAKFTKSDINLPQGTQVVVGDHTARLMAEQGQAQGRVL